MPDAPGTGNLFRSRSSRCRARPPRDETDRSWVGSLGPSANLRARRPNGPRRGARTAPGVGIAYPRRGWVVRTRRRRAPPRRDRRASPLGGVRAHRIGAADARARRVGSDHGPLHTPCPGDPRIGEDAVLLALREGVAVHGLLVLAVAAAGGEQDHQHGDHSRSHAGIPLRRTFSIASAKRSISPNVVYTFGVIRRQLNSGCAIAVTMIRCFS